MNRIGGFLCELSSVERAQPESLCRRIDVLDDAARLHLVGGRCEVGLDADRWAIAGALRQVADVVDPGRRRVLVSARCDRSALWAALLEDLGVHHQDMVGICRVWAPARGPLRYHRIERSGPLALITVTDGRECLSHTFDLDAGQLPVAVPVAIADSFSPPANPPTHWGTQPPRAGQVRSWIRGVLQGP